MEKFGIENLKKVLVFVIQMGNVGDKIGHDNKSAWKRWFALSDLFGPSVDLVKCDFKALKNEYEDLSDQEKLDLETVVANELKLQNVNLGNAIKDSFSVLINIESEIERAIDIFKNLKKA